MPSEMNRRELLRAGAVIAAGGTVLASPLGALAGCGDGDAGSTTSGAGSPDWDVLASSLKDGSLVRPDDRNFELISRPLNQRYASIQPQGVAVCRGSDDVQAAVNWARESGVPTAIRSGGHNYAGYSTGPGLVINVGSMRDIEVDDRAMTVSAQPGARNTMIYDGLQPHGVAISAGRCPTVAVGGLVLGGGIGFSSRRLGLTCDHLIEAEIVTADGELLRCSEKANGDLFWALRGGGSGNFGVCTRYTFETRPVDDVTIYDVEWDWKDAPEVFAAFQAAITDAPDEFSARIGVGRGGEPESGGAGPQKVSALGQYFGPKDELLDLLQPALRTGKVKSELIEQRTFWQAKDYFYANTPKDAYAVKSDYLDEPLAEGGIEALVDAVDSWPGSSNDDGAGAAMFLAGGAINRDRARCDGLRPPQPVRGARNRVELGAGRGAVGDRRQHRVARRPGRVTRPARERLRVPELHRPEPARLAAGLLRRQLRAARRGQAALRPGRALRLRAGHSVAGLSVPESAAAAGALGRRAQSSAGVGASSGKLGAV